MKKYNIVSLESGRIRAIVMASGFDDAVEKANEKLNCYVLDSYFVETAEETQKQRELQSRWFNLQIQ